MHHNICLRFESFSPVIIALAKIANHNKYITNRNPVKQKKAEDILSSCLFLQKPGALLSIKMFVLRTIVFILFLCYNYFSCIGSRNFAELMPGRADQWRLSSFRQVPFFTSAVLYIFT